MKNIIYTNLKNEKIFGVDLGLNYIDKLLDNFFEKEYKISESSEKIELKLLDYRKEKEFTKVVDKQTFQSDLQEFYKSFLESEYFTKFNWYLNFSKSIKRICYEKFEYDSENIINFFTRYAIISLVIYSCGRNEYNYDQVYKYLKNIFIITGISEKESSSFVTEIFNGLSEDKLIIFDRKLFFYKKSFSLSDRFFDVTLYANSMLLPYVYLSDINVVPCIRHNSLQKLENLKTVISKISLKLQKEKENPEFCLYAQRYFPEIFSNITDYSVIDFDYMSKLKDIDQSLCDKIYAFHFYKVLLNEYCFNVIIMSVFSEYYTDRGLKNLLDSVNDSYFA